MRRIADNMYSTYICMYRTCNPYSTSVPLDPMDLVAEKGVAHVMQHAPLNVNKQPEFLT